VCPRHLVSPIPLYNGRSVVKHAYLTNVLGLDVVEVGGEVARLAVLVVLADRRDGARDVDRVDKHAAVTKGSQTVVPVLDRVRLVALRDLHVVLVLELRVVRYTLAAARLDA
jgi:hypothetical protein